jgi:hypothetical protein
MTFLPLMVLSDCFDDAQEALSKITNVNKMNAVVFIK